MSVQDETTPIEQADERMRDEQLGERDDLGIEGARQKYTDELVAKDGVEAVGLGNTEDGRDALVVFVSSADVGGVPEELDGFPVVKEVRADK